jgi:hypothetical protein
MNIEIVSGDPRERREDVVSEIAAREYAAIIAEGVRMKLERYINLEVFATQQDDHTKSLSERVTHLERELGQMREAQRQFFDNVRWREEHATFWRHVRHLFSRQRWR